MQVSDVTIDLVNRTNQQLIDNIESRLEARKWKVPRLAKETGISASGLYSILSGESWPGPDNLDRIARALGTKAWVLLAPSNELPEPSGAQIVAELAEALLRPACAKAIAATIDEARDSLATEKEPR